MKNETSTNSFVSADPIGKLLAYTIAGIALLGLLVCTISLSVHYNLFPLAGIPFNIRMLIAPLVVELLLLGIYFGYKSTSSSIKKIMPWIIGLLTIFFILLFSIYLP